MILERLKAELVSFYHLANKKTRGSLEIWRQAFIRFSQMQGLEGAASIAYFTIFSIFPLLLVLISVAGFLLSGQEAVDLVMEFISQVAPTTPNGMEQTLRQVVQARDISGIVGLGVLLISASGVFTTLARNINRAWPEARNQSLVRSQLIAFGLIALLVSLMILWVIWTTLIGFISAQEFSMLERIVPFHEYVLTPLGRLFPLIASFLLFLIVYHWLPNTHVSWPEALWGALVANAAWGLLTVGFSWFLQSGLARYDLLYGSLGTSIALLTWVYGSALILLFGGHLSASIARATRLKSTSL